ncbi:MAG TPA: hypothetical protein VM778_11490 [Gemmatimonadota bacterium]|nr:hypothetical protein [Gemmatimonadota bacterium]
MRELLVYLGVSAILLPFLLFVLLGWPGEANSCIQATPEVTDTCYCEAFDPGEIGDSGVRQPFNTWSNLYSLLTGGLVALAVWWTRTRGSSSYTSRMGRTEFFPLTYIGVVVFLGLGSMWFHASLVGWGGVFDNLSMYTFSNFILFYTLTRVVDDSRMFYLGYPLTVVALTVFNAAGADGFALISAAISVYVALELYIAFWIPSARTDLGGFLFYYLPAVMVFGLAIVVWVGSQTGGFLCDPDSGFQWHGVWHWLAGLSAVFLYFYWRRARR